VSGRDDIGKDRWPGTSKWKGLLERSWTVRLWMVTDDPRFEESKIRPP
jgi:hypothetical protein